MKSIRAIYKVGKGPSSSHSMGPAKAAGIFMQGLISNNLHIKAILYDSLAATGKGHYTDKAIREILFPMPVEFEWKEETTLSKHPNAMDFIAYNVQGQIVKQWRVYSIGGGLLCDDNGSVDSENIIDYPHNSFKKLFEFCEKENISFWEYIKRFDDSSIWPYLENIWKVMKEGIERGLTVEEEFLPGPLKLKRRAGHMLKFANRRIGSLRDRNLLSSYALSLAEENATGGTVVTAPTCGSCGVLPAILYFFWQHYDADIANLTKALAIAGLVGSTVVENASISGAEVGCQGEIGVACSMAAAAATFLLNGSNKQVEYAAEMGLEHFLGLTCDPIEGLVQVPCIERNAFAAMRAMDCAAYALATEGSHLVSLDDVIDVMNDTGRDLQ
jgi:L-serine dehydratase